MGDVDKDGEIDFREFLNYCVEHEKKLRLVFQAMDTNKDGTLLNVATERSPRPSWPLPPPQNNKGLRQRPACGQSKNFHNGKVGKVIIIINFLLIQQYIYFFEVSDCGRLHRLNL